MTGNGAIQLALYLIVLLLLVKPLGLYMARVYEGKTVGLDRVLGPLERLIYRARRRPPRGRDGWKTYAIAMLLFNLAGILVVYLLQRFQGVLPLNPQGLGAVSPDSSFNTAVSFATNTNWQGYGGETTMSYLTQMLGLTVQNFVSAAAGMAVARRAHPRLRAPVGRDHRQLLGRPDAEHALHPAAAVVRPGAAPRVAGRGPDLRPYAKVAVAQPSQYDVPETDKDGKPVLDDKGQPKTTKATLTEQVLAVGPAASQIAIKQLGTNGGGFFNVNSAHPFENPTPLSNFLEMLSILLIPAALCYTFGEMVGDTRQGWAVLAAMTVIFVALLVVCVVAEQRGQTRRLARGRSPGERAPGGRQHGGQGGPLRHRQLGALGDGDDRRLERLGQLDARLLHAARRAGADVADAARRGRSSAASAPASTACSSSRSSRSSSPG